MGGKGRGKEPMGSIGVKFNSFAAIRSLKLNYTRTGIGRNRC